MKVYTTNTKEKKNKKSLLALVIGLTLIACAIIITLCVTLTGRTQDVGGNVIPPINEQAEKYVMPFDEYAFGKEFSDKVVYNKTLKQWRTHNGVDFMVEKGTEVKAIFGGKVAKIQNTTLEGTVITIEQNDGVTTYYKSLSSEVAVNEGDTVKAGDIIGSVDNTMSIEKSEGVHLHLEMMKDGKYLDPLEYLPEGGVK